jgi:hypothetical protein
MNAKLRALVLLTGWTALGLSTTSCKSEEEEQFGFTCVELNRGESVDDSPFVGTTKIKITLNYEPCLVKYYTEKHPEMRLDGPADQGGAVFAEWKERLCSEDIERGVDCTIESFEQILSATGTMPVYQMSIDYNITDGNMLEGRRLLWGPGPLPAYAECDGELKPFVSLSALSGVIGYNKGGAAIWQVQSFDSSARGVMSQTAGGCIQTFIAPI